MFFKLLYFDIKRLLRTRELLFWNLCFPLILGTLFTMTFGKIMENTENFRAVLVAYVTEENEDEMFTQVLEELAEEEEPLIELKRVDMEEGKRLLLKKSVTGILKNASGSIELYVNEEGVSQSILKAIVEQYRQRQAMINQIAAVHPERLPQMIQKMETETETSILREEAYTEGSMNNMNGYFYALIAMNCLYGCFGGLNCARNNKVDLSLLAVRKNIAGTGRFVIMVAELVSYVMGQFSCTVISVCYLKYVMHVAFGNRIPQMLLVIFAGAFVGTATGFFIGTLGRLSEGSRYGITIAITMIECFFSGLMVGNMYHIIQKVCPLLNKINPASLIVDALYSLDIYRDYTRFGQNLMILGIFAVVLCLLGYFRVRRERYASI